MFGFIFRTLLAIVTTVALLLGVLILSIFGAKGHGSAAAGVIKDVWAKAVQAFPGVRDQVIAAAKDGFAKAAPAVQKAEATTRQRLSIVREEKAS